LSEKDYKRWLGEHLTDPQVSIFESNRIFNEDFKKEKFKLMEQGALVTDGATFEDLKKFLLK
jgi:hypothetical protein